MLAERNDFWILELPIELVSSEFLRGFIRRQLGSTLFELDLDLASAQARNVEWRALEALLVCLFASSLLTDLETWLCKRLGLFLSSLDKTCFALGLRLLELGLAQIQYDDFALYLGNILIYLDECLFDTI